MNKAGANPNSRVRLTKAPTGVAKSTPQNAKPTSPAPPTESKKLSDAEIHKRFLTAIRELQTNERGQRNASAWVDFCQLGTAARAAGVDVKALEKRLPGSSELFEMKLRFDAAVELAKKRVAANFRTAVPSFNPRKRNVCYLLPLTLTARREAPERADVALVVERLPETGVYQGHTVYTLDTAYQTARLTARLGGENWLDG